MKNSLDVCQKIYQTFKNNINFNFKEFTQDVMLNKILNYSSEKLLKEWRLNAPIFYNEFKDKIEIDKINKYPSYYMNRLEYLYNNLTLLQIKMFYIIDFKSFKRLIDKQVISKLMEEKNDKGKFYLIEKEIEKDCIIEKNKNGEVVKKYFNIDLISKKLNFKIYRIYEILEKFSKIEYKGMHEAEYLKLNNKNIFSSISNCGKHGNIYVSAEILKGRKAIRMICTKCFKEFYIIASPQRLYDNWEYNKYCNQEYKKESTLIKFGYKYKTPKEERMEILKEVTDKHIWDEHGIANFLKNRIKNANSRGLYEYAQSLNDDLLDYCAIYGLSIY